MSSLACPCVVLAIDHIELVMRKIEYTLNPQENLKDEVVALHDIYLKRKIILEEINTKHVALRHQQRLLAREGVVDGAAHCVRVPRPARVPGACTAVAALSIKPQPDNAHPTVHDESTQSHAIPFQ